MNRHVLVIRHAEAEEPAHSLIAGRNDSQRELTKEGRRKMRAAEPNGGAAFSGGRARKIRRPGRTCGQPVTDRK